MTPIQTQTQVPTVTWTPTMTLSPTPSQTATMVIGINSCAIHLFDDRGEAVTTISIAGGQVTEGAPVSVWTGASANAQLGYPVCFFSVSRFLAGWNGLGNQGQTAPSGIYYYAIQCDLKASTGRPSGSFQILNQPNDLELQFTARPNLLNRGDRMEFKTAWSIGVPAAGKIVVFNLSGERVAEFRVETLTTSWTPGTLASGLYFVVLTSNNPISGTVTHQLARFMIGSIARP